MKIYLVRHGEANPEEIDPEKNLSDSGRNEIKHLAESIRHLNITVKEMRHSGKARARQTAEILADSISSESGLIKKAGLNPNDPVAPVADELTALGEDITLVGHLPFLARLTSYLLTGNELKSAFNFEAGGMVCLEHNKRKWSLSWFVNPDLYRKENAGSFRSYH
jgi:phosphohistidine phosphatase